MPLGAARISFLAKTQVTAVAEVIRYKKGLFTVKDPEIDTAQSKFGGASALFQTTGQSNGTSDNIRTSASDDFIFDSDFTWECWVRFTDNGTNDGYVFLSNRGGFNSTNLYVQARQLDNKWQWGNSTMGANVTTQTWSYNTWYHVALVRNGTGTNNFAFYVNGTQLQTDTDTNTIGASGSSDYISIGSIYNATTPSFGLNGHIDEVRISTVARYTGNFTVPTAPFVNDDDTVLLVHMDGTDGSTTFVDDNGVRAPQGVSAVNNAQIDTAQSQFGGASLYLDSGYDDYISVDATNNTIDFSGDFTIEGWFRFDSISSNQKFFDLRDDDGDPALGNTILIDYSSGFRCWVNGSNRVSGSPTASTGTWYHIAFVRDGNFNQFYVNGTRYANYEDTTPLDYTIDYSFVIGSNGSQPGVQGLNGWIDEVRFSDTARYTGTSLTVPTAPFVNDANTLLLLHMDGTDASTTFVDDNGTGRAQQSAIAFNQAQISTAQSQFGNSSAVFDGNNDYLQIGSPNSINDTSTDFTFEGWFRFDINPESQTLGGGSYIMLATVSSTTYILCQEVGGERAIQVADSGTYMQFEESGGSGWSTNTWYHIAIVRISNQYDIYIDGTALPRPATSVKSGGFAGGGAFTIGRFIDSRGSMDGYIDELRISSVGRYTGNFTPSTTPFVNDANTLLLLHMDGTDASTVFTDDNGVY